VGDIFKFDNDWCLVTSLQDDGFSVFRGPLGAKGEVLAKKQELGI